MVDRYNESGWEEIYHADSGASFNGDGERYHIVTYEQEDVIENMVAWSAEEGSSAQVCVLLYQIFCIVGVGCSVFAMIEFWKNRKEIKDMEVNNPWSE